MDIDLSIRIFGYAVFYIIILCVVATIYAENNIKLGDQGFFICFFWPLCFILWLIRLVWNIVFHGGKEFFNNYFKGFK